MKPKIADLEHYALKREFCLSATVLPFELQSLLRLARAAKAVSMYITPHVAEDQDLMRDLDSTIDAFDWSDE